MHALAVTLEEEQELLAIHQSSNFRENKNHIKYCNHKNIFFKKDGEDTGDLIDSLFFISSL